MSGIRLQNKTNRFRVQMWEINKRIAHNEHEIGKHERLILKHKEKIATAKQELIRLLNEYGIPVEALRSNDDNKDGV